MVKQAVTGVATPTGVTCEEIRMQLAHIQVLLD
jgi:hypothetical protein